jgi:hypothetical protein
MNMYGYTSGNSESVKALESCGGGGGIPRTDITQHALDCYREKQEPGMQKQVLINVTSVIEKF